MIPSNWKNRDRVTGWIFKWSSVFIIPLIIVIGSATVLFWAPHQFDVPAPNKLSFSVISDPSSTFTPDTATALANHGHSSVTNDFSTHLAETPFWLTFTVNAVKSDLGTFVDFPSRHAQTLTCWKMAPALTLIGTGNRNKVSGAIRSSKAGFSLKIDTDGSVDILCRGTFSGPAHIVISVMSGENLSRASLSYQQNTSLITGGLVTLAIFVFVAALINREWTYVIFAAWLVGNLRLSANAMGFDNEWLGRLIPSGHLEILRTFTFASYYVITGTLFENLFHRELKSIGQRWGWRMVRYVGCLLMVAAFTLNYEHFLPVLWISTSFGVCVVTYFILLLVLRGPSRTVLWFTAAIAVVLYATLSEVVAAALGLRAISGVHSSVVTALSSSMLCAFAIAEKMREERERRRQVEVELRNTYDVAPIGLFTLTLDNRFVRANPAAHSMLGLSPQLEDQRYWGDCLAPGAQEALNALLNKDGSASVEIDGLAGTRTASRRYSLRAIRTNSLIEGSLEDVTDESNAVKQLHFMAEHDPLTGLLNRHGLEQAINKSVAENRPRVFAYLDLDRFKVFNDIFGHRTGDEILRYVGRHIVQHIGIHAPAARVGGDEFVFILTDLTIDEAIELCTELLASLHYAPIQVDTQAFQVRGSIGIVDFIKNENFDDNLALADRACRAAKRNGSGKLFALRKGAKEFEERAEEISLIEALGQNRLPDGLFLVMQPVMSVKAPEESLDFEVLLRLRTPEGAVATAGKLIAAAEDSGMIMAIDRWVMTTVLEWLRENQASLTTTRFVSVNLSAGSLNDESFLHELFILYAKYPEVIHFLCIEITESVALHDLEHTEHFISRVHAIGAKIAIDDFGAGQTSLRYLKKLSADALKIDGEFIRSMCNHPTDIAIVEALISLARSLGMRSIAEWVEDADTYIALETLGVDYVQGFGVARPQEAHHILARTSAAGFITDPVLKSHLVRQQLVSEGFDVAPKYFPDDPLNRIRQMGLNPRPPV